MTTAIFDFLNERKAAWLKAKLPKDAGSDVQQQLEQEASDRFALASWLPDAARRVSQLSMVSHPGKFSHPSAKTSSIIASASYAADGYLRSGNVDYALDVFGNAAAMDVYKFLSIVLSDGQSVLAHIEADSDLIKPVLTMPTASYAELKQGLLSIKQQDASSRTDRLVKQVYFPLVADNSAGGYHLLSLLTPSGLLSLLKQRVDAIRFSEETKAVKELRRKNEFSAQGYSDLLNLTVTAFGGTQPQNISVLNSQNAGRAYLLPSVPPVLEVRDLRRPARDFFSDTLNPYFFKQAFLGLHKLMGDNAPNNYKVRSQITAILVDEIIGPICEKAQQLRALEAGWSDTESYQALPLVQKTWLDAAYVEQRAEKADWLNEISKRMAGWIVDHYEKLVENAFELGDGEYLHVRQFVDEEISNNREFLK